MKHFSIIFIALMFVLSIQSAKAQEYWVNPIWSSADTSFTMSVAVGKLDSNQYLDIVAGNYLYPYTWTTNLDTGAANYSSSDFGDSLRIYWDANTIGAAISVVGVPGRLAVDKIDLMDFDSNGYLDILLGCTVLKDATEFDGKNFILLNRGNRSFILEDLSVSDNEDTHDIAAGDINNDGVCDVVSVDIPLCVIGKLDKYRSYC